MNAKKIKATAESQVDETAESKVDWNVVGDFVGECAGNKFRCADTTTAAILYFLSMGIAQTFADVSAARADFVGVKTDGSKAKNPWVTKYREVEASALDMPEYDDASMDDRNTLADLYFAFRAKDKFTRILSGALTHGGGRGSRIDSATKLRHEVTEFLIVGNVKFDNAYAKFLAWPGNVGKAAAQGRRDFLDAIYERVADLQSAVNDEVARRKEAKPTGLAGDDLDDLLN